MSWLFVGALKDVDQYQNAFLSTSAFSYIDIPPIGNIPCRYLATCDHSVSIGQVQGTPAYFQVSQSFELVTRQVNLASKLFSAQSSFSRVKIWFKSRTKRWWRLIRQSDIFNSVTFVGCRKLLNWCAYVKISAVVQRKWKVPHRRFCM